MKTQKGITLVGMLLVCIVIVIVAVGGLKIAPAYIEYYKLKKAVVGIVKSGDARGSVMDIRAAFDRRQAIDDFEAVTAKDLEISKDGNLVVISFSYAKRIPLFSNVSVLIDFAASSSD
jgi:Tfp pilus assembly protein PilE